MANPAEGQKKLYSEAVHDGSLNNMLCDKKMYKLFIKSKSNQSVEYTKTLLKTKVNPTKIKVGISALKTLKNGQILIESDKKDELVKISQEIEKSCGNELESYLPKLRNTRLIIFNIPEDIKLENAAEAIVSQNSELDLSESDLTPKFVFEDRKKHKNLIIEVNSETRKRLLGRKLKIGWHVCNNDDYLTVMRCHKCCKYNHRKEECVGEIVCPHCAEKHERNECKANKENLRCVNCINYNKYNKTAPVNINHSSLDKTCSCYVAALKKNANRTDY